MHCYAHYYFVNLCVIECVLMVTQVTRQDLAGWSFTSGVSNYTLCGPPGEQLALQEQSRYFAIAAVLDLGGLCDV